MGRRTSWYWFCSLLFICSSIACKPQERFNERMHKPQKNKEAADSQKETSDPEANNDNTASEEPDVQDPAGDNTDPGGGLDSGALAPPPNTRVAFVGDVGVTSDSKKVMGLVKAENPALFLILGDFDYKSEPKTWAKTLDQELGATFPIMAVAGNHDQAAWSGYKPDLDKRLKVLGGDAKCEGEYAIRSNCIYKGLQITLSAVGLSLIGENGTPHETYINDSLTKTKAIWKICAWHKNMRKMQVGGKKDETGWKVYETCRQHGAIVATAHEHSYSRTHLLSSFQNQTVASTDNTLVLEPGKSFAFVSGLGGASIRSQALSGDWWAKIYTSKQKAKPGVLFCDFHVNNNPRKAHCYFKNISGDIIDDFYLESRLEM